MFPTRSPVIFDSIAAPGPAVALWLSAEVVGVKVIPGTYKRREVDLDLNFTDGTNVGLVGV